MTDSSSLPSRRRSLSGTDLDGHPVELSVTVAHQLYRCPGCRGYIDVGSEHVLVRYPGEEQGFHRHWHRPCGLEFARGELRDLHSATSTDRAPTKGQRRQTALQRRRRA